MELSVKSYMESDPQTVSDDITVAEAVQLMYDGHNNGLIIVDDARRVVGILSTWDLIEYLVPDSLETDKHLASFEAPDTFIHRMREIAADPITNCMTSKVKTISVDASIMEAATLLSEFHLRQLPVIEVEHRLVGRITRTHMKHAMKDALTA